MGVILKVLSFYLFIKLINWDVNFNLWHRAGAAMIRIKLMTFKYGVFLLSKVTFGNVKNF